MVVHINRYIVQLTTFLIFSVGLISLQFPDERLHIIACDVGQGDAILTTYKSTQILTDGGPNDKVLDCLSKYIPFWDKHIELVISTHPDADHSTGLVEVVRRYNVDAILINELDPGTQVYKALENTLGSRGVRRLKPYTGMHLGLGLIHLDILHPPAGYGSDKTNEYSIVYVLRYGNFKAIFTGDLSKAISEDLTSHYEMGEVNYVKVPHHGSKNGLTENLLRVLKPGIAVVSVGKNSYGHPTKEILDLLNKYYVKTYRTDLVGNVEIITDGFSVFKGN